MTVRTELEVGGQVREVVVTRVGDRFHITVSGREYTVSANRVDPTTWSLLVGAEPSASYEVAVVPGATPGQLMVRVGSVHVPVTINGRAASRHHRPAGAASGPQHIVAPMPGKVVRVLVAPGEAVKARQPLVVIEAMKMENELRALADGTVAEVRVQAGQSVDAGALVAVIGPGGGS